VLEKTIAALKDAEAAIQEEYEGVKGWHAQGRGVLEEAYTAVTGWRQKLEGIEPSAPLATESAGQQVDATPAALAHAESLGVDISQIKGTGKDGKVTKGDVEAAVAAKEGALA
jgi:pyruvate/2-oxoglutarate dehydrogenase complex dihydrolipoamide acyltransferase (E2) component